jgi:acetate---CoA ligase (ADP-forming)
MRPPRPRIEACTTGVAIVGVRPDSRWTGLLLPNLTGWGYRGEIWPVSTSHAELMGYQAFPSLDDLPDVPEVAFLAVSAERTIELVRTCVALRIPHVVAIADGFAERGTDEGRARQQELADLVQGSSTRLYGPNCVGFADFRSGLCPVAAPIARDIAVGNVGIISQSGSLLSSISGALVEEGLGADWCASVGNGAAFDVTDALEYLINRDTTDIICGYIETFGTRASRERVEALFARAALLNKPIVLIKAGATARSARIALSHTASVAGADRLINEVMRRHGAIRAHSTEELVRTVALLEFLGRTRKSSLLRSGGVAVIEGSGGATAEAADRLLRGGVALARFSESTRTVLTETAPTGAFVDNPVDLTASPKSPETILNAYESIYKDPDVALVLVPWSLTFPGDEPHRLFHHETLDRYTVLSRQTGTPTIISSTSLHRWTERILEFRKNHPEVLVVRGLDATVAALRHVFPALKSDEAGGPEHVDSESKLLGEADGRSVLERVGMPIIKGVVWRAPYDDSASISRLQMPVVVKLLADGVAHRARIGGVVVGCRTLAEARRAGRTILENVTRAGVSDKRITGLLVEEMAFGPELLVAFDRDPWFGPHLVLGHGGVDVEQRAVPSLVALPSINVGSAVRELQFIGSAVVRPDVIDQLTQLIDSLAEEFVNGELRRFKTVELNPVILTSSGPKIADVLIIP